LAPWQSLLVLLQTVPRIDQVSAAMLLVEIGTDMSQFGSAERLACWVGNCAEKRKSAKTRKGNAWVRRLLCELAQAAARSRCALKEKFTALTIRKGHKKSIVALGALKAPHHLCPAHPPHPLSGRRRRRGGHHRPA
jgi:transposase